MSKTGEVIVIPKEGEYDVEWKMDFASLKGYQPCYWTEHFSFEGESWNLAIWPNGCESKTTTDYIDLRVSRISCNTPSMDMELSIAFKGLNGQKLFKKQITKVFEGIDHHDIDRFLSRSEFEEKKSQFLSSGFLTVVCTLKRLNSAESASNLAAAVCSYCNKTFNSQEISLHEKKCRIKCPECSDIILLEKWNDHECQITRAEDETSVSGLSDVRNHDNILQDLKQLFMKQENCDVVLRVKGQEFRAHKAILIARSPVFASKFRNEMKEKETDFVDIEDCDPSVFLDYLFFLYSDDVDSLSKEKVFGLFNVANKYDVPDLRKMCLAFMKGNLSVETFCETLTLALQHTETELIQLATNFFIRNSKKILETDKWQSFAAENPTRCSELFIQLEASDRGPNP